MSRTRKRAQAGLVRLPSPRRPFAGREPGEDRALAHSREVNYLRTLALYAMR
jgi:hypothetical protein